MRKTRATRESTCSITTSNTANNNSKKRKSFVFFVTIMMLLTLASNIFNVILLSYIESKKKSDEAISRKVKVRKSWSEENKRFSDRMFYRLFRMHRPCFNRLCSRIQSAVGEKEFKSENYIEKLKRLGSSTPESRMFHAAQSTSGTYILGEIKVCLALRYLAGGTYLNLYLWYNADPNYIMQVVHNVIEHWFCNDRVITIDIYKNLFQSSTTIQRISREFATGSGGILQGCIGAIDGWLVKIKCPSLFEVINPGKYMSRKGFFSLNVQAIVDKKKRILWRHIGQKGSSHDSSVFKNTKLYQHLLLISNELFEKGLYLVGDSAYSIRNFILCPYDNTRPNSNEDSFNYFLSSQRIYVECAFGEIDRRWGVFWKPLEGSLVNHKHTIDAAMCLHNFIVEYREEMKNNGMSVDSEEYENEELRYDSDEYLLENPGETIGVFGDNVGVRGRQETDQTLQINRGLELRDKLCEALKDAGLSRPGNSSIIMHRDRHNRTVETNNE